MALRMVMGKAFPQGPFKLGVLQPVINAGAIIYMVVSVVRPLPLTSIPICGPSALYSFLPVQVLRWPVHMESQCSRGTCVP